MPAGNISNIERLQKMCQVRDLVESGLTDTAIAKKIGVEPKSVQRMKKYLDELARTDLTSKEISKKRAELYLEITEAAVEAKKLFDKLKAWVPCKMCKGTGELTSKKDDSVKPCYHCKGLGGFIRSGDAKKFFDAWMDSIDRRMRLYGLDQMKGGDMIFNQQVNTNQYIAPDRVDGRTAARITDALKSSHESSIQEKYEDSREY